MIMRMLIGSLLVAAVACNEPLASKPASAPDPALEVGLVLSDSMPAVGSSVDVSAQMGSAVPSIVGSFTARIRYDSTALRYQDELPIGDGALRATNATAGQVRFAGAASNGLPNGRLAAFRFVVLRGNALRTLQLVVDEMHTVARTDAASQLRIVPARTRPAP
jgi:hypothetical protein